MIRKSLAAAAGLFLAACTTVTPQAPSATEKRDVVQMMVLGTYHFDNPGLDVVNTKVDDVLVPRRQAELKALAGQLASFRPTAIAVETTWRDDQLLSEGYKAFTPEKLATDRNEIVQIGYRLANELGVDRVYGVDENEGEISFFPFDRVQELAARTGQTNKVEALIAAIQAEASAQEASQAEETISQTLARHNIPEDIRTQHNDFYYGLMELSEPGDPAGAALNYGWYARNALIFANITQVTEPGDRILVLYGSGHAYWLRHFAEETPGFELVEPLPYLTGQEPNGS
ncbi:MAG: DUF5694 domain-containing protein [Hyphomonas sp.]|uniref:DUF5694 domain-containing protein n=1 Tax=Hyphomonas sp. TaxID=87 RepID=UPI003527C9FB